MRQQFSCRENIEMSQFGFDFLRRANELLEVEGEKPPDVQFNHAGYLILAGELLWPLFTTEKLIYSCRRPHLQIGDLEFFLSLYTFEKTSSNK